MATLSFPLPNSLLRRQRSPLPTTQIKSLSNTSHFRRSSLQTPSPSEVSADESSFSSPSEAVSNDGDFPSETVEELQARGCKTCGRDETVKGCNGEGRIQGGIATVPGFGWWPIKAYRPCPGFVASGGRYRRRGQSMDEVAFGREETEALIGSTDKVRSSKKSSGPRRSKG